MRRIEKKTEMMRRGLKKDLKKVRRRLRREPHCLSPASVVILSFITLGIFLAWLSNCVSKKIKKQK